MLLKISVLILTLFFTIHPSYANSQSPNQAGEIFFHANNELFRSVPNSSEMVKVPGLQIVGSIGYNPVAKALFVSQQSTPSSIENFVSVSYDQAKSWEIIRPSDTGIIDPYTKRPVDSFGDFAISDSGILVADVGYGTISIRNQNKTWQKLNLRASSTNLSIVGDILYLVDIVGQEGKLVAVDLKNPSKISTHTIVGFEGPSDNRYVESFANGTLFIGRYKIKSLIEIKNGVAGVIKTLTTDYGFMSAEGYVSRGDNGKYQIYDTNFQVISSFEPDKGDIGYQFANGCVWVIRTSSLGCKEKSVYTFPSKISAFESDYSNAVFVGPFTNNVAPTVTSTQTPTPTPTPTAAPKLDPILFVSGLGGGNDGDLYWEGKNPEKVTLATISGLEFDLSISVWTTGQKGYFLTFDHHFTPDICKMAEMVGRSVDYIRLRTQAKKVDLIGYSMGGLLSRCFIEGLVESYPYDNSVDELLLIAVPNNGSFAATLAGPAIYLGDLIKGFQASSLSSFSPQIKTINTREIPDNVKTTVIYGGGLWLPILERNDGLVSISNTRLDPEVKKSVRYIYLSKAVHANRFAFGSERYPILEDQIRLADSIRQMGENTQ